MVDRWLIETHEPSFSERLVEKFSVSGFSPKKIRQLKFMAFLLLKERRARTNLQKQHAQS
jgi:hypothetical protein